MKLYDASKILTEEVLTLADLSPAPIKMTRSLEMAVRASMVAKAMREQRDALLARSQPVVQEKKSESPPIRSFKPDRDEKGSDGEACTGEWVHDAEKIARDMHTDASSLRDGDTGFVSNSVFKYSSGGEDKDTLEKYRRTLRLADQSALAGVPLVKLEDVAAYHSLAINGVTHHLLLRAAYLKNELLSCESKLKEANQKAKDRGSRTEFDKKLEQSLNDLKHEKMMLRKRIEELKLARDCERKESFNAGQAAGRQEFMESDEYLAAMKRTREETLKAFRKSNTYATLVAKKASVYEFDGFSKCRSQATKFGAFRKEFDPCRLDPFKNESLEDPVFEEDEGDDAGEEDEFAYLLQLPDQTNSRNPGD